MKIHNITYYTLRALTACTMLLAGHIASTPLRAHDPAKYASSSVLAEGKWGKVKVTRPGKLSPNVTSIADIAKAVEAEGADSVSLINTLMGMAIDVERRRPCLSTVTGGLSGPAVRPVAVRMVWQVAKAVNIPVIGLGGIMDGRDALEFILAGATAIQVGTANFVDPSVTMKIIDYMEDYCSRHGVDDINSLVGAINR